MQFHTIDPFHDQDDAIPRDSWMSLVLNDDRLAPADGGDAVMPVIPVPQQDKKLPLVKALLVSLDIGNDAIKVGVVDPTRRFISTRIPTTYRTAEAIRYGGTGHSAWKVLYDGSDIRYWVGEDAFDGDALPLGPTHQRLLDLRYRRFVQAALVQGLINAGYPPGDYALAIGIGVRNEEIEEIDGRQQLLPATKAALKGLRGEYQIEHYNGIQANVWTLSVITLIPAAQTLGSFFAWYYRLDRTPAQRGITKLAILDYGGGDTHLLEVELRPGRMIVTGERLGDGTVEIANALREMVKKEYDIELTIAEAQSALISGTISKAGRATSIAEMLVALKRSRVENLLGRAMPVLQDRKRYLIHTSGGAVLMREEIEERMARVGRDHESFLIVPAEIAPFMNAVGLWAFAYYRLLDEQGKLGL